MSLYFHVSPFRLVHSGSTRGSPAQGSDLVFATRTGTGRGIESHIFRVETHWDLSSWTRALVQGAHTAAELIKEVSIGECACIYCYNLRSSQVLIIWCNTIQHQDTTLNNTTEWIEHPGHEWLVCMFG